MKLSELGVGKTAIISEVKGQKALRGHLLDMGLTPNTCVTVRAVAPMGDPIELGLRGYRLTLRLEDADNIEVSPVTAMCSGNCSCCSSNSKKRGAKK